MPGFVNPNRNQKDVYIQENVLNQVDELIEQEDDNVPSLFSEHTKDRYSDERIQKIIEKGNWNYPRPEDTVHIDENIDIASEIDSFTGQRIVSDIIEKSEILDIRADTEHGLFQLRSYKTAEHDTGWSFWLPFVDDSSGTIMGRMEDPSGNENMFFEAEAGDYSIDTWIDNNFIEALYTLARETVPETPDYTMEGIENQLKSQFDQLEGKLAVVSRLEEEGEVKIGNHDCTGCEGFRGGGVTNLAENFFNNAKKAGLIDYTVSNHNKENLLKVEDGGYKFLTRNLGELGYSDTEEVIDERLIPQWKN